uniref:hypothetical protein n=1 Tax=Alistipes onderdonkii TaxID=328813 RepID=UPI0040285A50
MKRLFFALALCAASGACMVGGDMRFYEARSDKIRFTGRAAENGDGSLSFDWSGCHFTFRFDGSRCAMRAADTGVTTTTYSSTGACTARRPSREPRRACPSPKGLRGGRIP